MINYKSLDEILRGYIDNEDIEHKKTVDNDKWFASELGMCKRKVIFRRLGLEPTDEMLYRIRFVGRDGTAGHEWRQEGVKKMGALIASELRLADEGLSYRGRLDLIVRLNDKPVLIDIKTQRSEAFFRRAKKPADQKIEEFQKMQLSSYVYFFNKNYSELLQDFGFPVGTKVEESRIYYVDRGGGCREEYIFHFKQDQFDKVTAELNELNKHWTDKTLPAKTKTSKWLCRFCPYKKICDTKVEGTGKKELKQLMEIYGNKTKR